MIFSGDSWWKGRDGGGLGSDIKFGNMICNDLHNLAIHKTLVLWRGVDWTESNLKKGLMSKLLL